ncbi:hypothetical protein C6502_17175 [Candidatus Poribacteria bacterium]|nr:MAG: hypothetical protein C6502_17175 [Candidatus Poribacteria bacterium]
MKTFTERILWVAVLLLVTGLFIIGCGDDETEDVEDLLLEEEEAAGTTLIEVPPAYVFDSRFVQGESSVAYSGQTVRNLLLQDLKVLIDSLAKDGAQPIAVQDMLNLYTYDDALNLQSLSTAGATPVLESHYSAISTGKSLVGKISGDVVIGYNRTADDLVNEWFQIIADNSQDPAKLGTPAVYTTDNGVDLTQMINKVLIGAVPYYQATGVYLAGLLERDNSEARNGTDPYTSMEHGWDEAFGYFGAARDYFRYTDAELAGGVDDFTFDSNGDGSIDFKSEYNFGLSRNAGKRDKGGSGVDLTREIFDAFLRGRTFIANQGTEVDIIQQRELAANSMEKVIAATIVHYVNDTLSDMSNLGTDVENRVNLNKHWAEMKGFTVALQYNPFKLIGDGQLQELHGIMGEAPSYDAPGTPAYDTTVRNYNRAKDVLQAAYGFSAANMANW